jgi:formamidopyrimidine-DNA glycosylase
MPELPEVEIASRNLRRWLGKRRLTEVELPPSRILRGAKPSVLHTLLDGQTVRAVERRGKWIRMAFSSGAALYSHLGMTGKWVKRAASDEAQPYERARLDAGDRSVRYLDPRLFGRLVGVTDGALIPEWEALGPDPLADGLDAAQLSAALGRTRRSVKEALLDQTLIAGLGNIQAAEALWRARIDPRVRADQLATEGKRVRALVDGIHATIAFTLDAEKAPEITYVEEPGADNPFQVYGKAGQPCPRGDGKIARVAQGGRSTFFCPHCQRKLG